MGYRCDRELTLTVALAFVDRFVSNAQAYFRRKAEIQAALEHQLASAANSLDRLVVGVNLLDDPTRGAAGMYLTVLGTSAEGGDGGQVGRGNRVNGLIALSRPMSAEAAAGKNPVSHVGKIYALLTQRMAEEVYAQVPGVREVYTWLGSQIGQPLDQPTIVAAQLILEPGVGLPDVQRLVEEIISGALASLPAFIARLTRGELPVW
jgi:S-adenosylmethionine synthetase